MSKQQLSALLHAHFESDLAQNYRSKVIDFLVESTIEAMFSDPRSFESYVRNVETEALSSLTWDELCGELKSYFDGQEDEFSFELIGGR